MGTYKRETRSLEELWRAAHTVAHVEVESIGPARTTLPEGRTPMEDDSTWNWWPGQVFPVTPVRYRILRTFKGNPPAMEWWSGGRLEHPPGNLYLSSEFDKWLPEQGAALVLFREAGSHDWTSGHGPEPLETRMPVATFWLDGSEAIYMGPGAPATGDLRMPRFPQSQFLDDLRRYSAPVSEA